MTVASVTVFSEQATSVISALTVRTLPVGAAGWAVPISSRPYLGAAAAGTHRRSAQVNKMAPSRPNRETSFGSKRPCLRSRQAVGATRQSEHRGESMAMTQNYRSAHLLRIAAMIAIAALLGIGAEAASAHARGPRAGLPAFGGFASQVVLNGADLSHAGGSEQLTKPDDITDLDRHIFVAFQNGVGPQGEASPTGNSDSTVVELDLSGHVLNQWDLAGKCDGLTADPATNSLVATVNEDAGSSLYTIDPTSGEIVHYSYNEPLPSDGGTDAISIYRGMLLISASAPGTTGAPAPQPSYPAVYRVELDASTQIATIHALFGDEATATEANLGTGGTVHPHAHRSRLQRGGPLLRTSFQG